MRGLVLVATLLAGPACGPTMPDTLDAIVLEPATGPADAAVVWLHGLGADGSDFEPIVPELRLPYGHRVRFVFPHAPSRPVTVNQGMVMRAWYDLESMQVDQRTDVAGIEESCAAVGQLISGQVAGGIDPGRIVLAGFSQGGAITLQAGLTHSPALAGLLILSAYLPVPDAIPRAGEDALPIFMAHGDYDPVIPVRLGEAARDRLEAAGYTVDWHQYPMQHAVHPREIEAIGDWLTAVLDLAEPD